jgi:hypothetical protein
MACQYLLVQLLERMNELEHVLLFPKFRDSIDSFIHRIETGMGLMTATTKIRTVDHHHHVIIGQQL